MTRDALTSTNTVQTKPPCLARRSGGLIRCAKMQRWLHQYTTPCDAAVRVGNNGGDTRLLLGVTACRGAVVDFYDDRDRDLIVDAIEVPGFKPLQASCVANEARGNSRTSPTS
jgi:hypothetical protein